MATYCMGFHYNEGKTSGYNISFPHGRGSGRTVLSNVSYKDRARVVREIVASGTAQEDIEIEKV